MGKKLLAGGTAWKSYWNIVLKAKEEWAAWKAEYKCMLISDWYDTDCRPTSLTVESELFDPEEYAVKDKEWNGNCGAKDDGVVDKDNAMALVPEGYFILSCLTAAFGA